MKRMMIEEMSHDVNRLVTVAKKERVLLTKGGKPFAFVTDASIYDEEDIGYMNDDNFWEMIRRRRQERGGIPIEQVMARIERQERLGSGKTQSSKKSKKGT